MTPRMRQPRLKCRARLVIYMEQRDINALTAHAKREGRLLVPWAREALMRAMEVQTPGPRREHGARTTLRAVQPGSDVHTAKSNRLTCMCPTCVEYRRAHSIPLGGFKK
jgi:hypothetical protein